ncbi:MAG TPA: zinc ribbon domain-containing protein [Thermoplasmata archaeon]|nr:zinc ribbon domain-containing protein [Thermoplasmata archaeon]
MICENCGLENPEGYKFCPRCGAVTQKRVKVDMKKIRLPREALIKIIQTRASSDEIVTPLWIYLMIVVYLASIVASVAIGFSIAGDILREDPSSFSRELMFEDLKDELWLPSLLSVIFYVFASSLAFLLISRLNKHFERDKNMRRGLLTFVTSAASTPDLKKAVEIDLDMMSQTDDLINSTEKRRTPIVWALVVAAPLMVSILQWAFIFNGESYQEYQRTSILFFLLQLVAYIPLFELSVYLGKSIYDHHNRWMEFTLQAATATQKLGFKEGRSYWARPMPTRAYALYVFVTIISVGLFMFYWWYMLIKEPNDHLKTQWSFEDAFVESISD